MRQYIIRRLAFLVPVVVVLSVVLFVALRLMPGDLAELMLGQEATEESLAALREKLGLDKPIPVQYWDWVKQVLSGDLGESIKLGTGVADEITTRLPITVELLAITVFFATTIGVTTGVISAVFQNSWLDYLARVVSILGLSIPAWWFGVMALIIPSLLWNYAPPIGYVAFFEDPWANLRQFVPPAFILGSSAAAAVMRIGRSSLLEVMRQDYIRSARAKGLREAVVVMRHAIKPAMIPVITVIGSLVAVLLGGAVLIEQVFSLPGIGNLIYWSVLNRDYPVIQTISLYIAVVVVLMNLLVDVTYAWFDPRIRYA